AFFQTGKGANQAGDNPQASRNAPERVGEKDPLQPVVVQLTSECAAAAPDSRKPDAQTQQVKDGEQPSQVHLLLSLSYQPDGFPRVPVIRAFSESRCASRATSSSLRGAAQPAGYMDSSD